MAIVEISTHLDAPPETVRAHIQRSGLLMHISAPLLRFRPIDPPNFPDIWTQGRYKASLWFLGMVPMGWQMIGIEDQPMRGDVWSMRDNGTGLLIKTWDHMIEIAPDGDGTHYTDRVTIKAGLLTPFIVGFAHVFYRHRQRRWRKLVANGFEYGP